MIAQSERYAPQERWADRGWWFAVEYGVLARDRFLKRLPRLRTLGGFKELLEPGGRIVYRNLFREHEVQAAWDLLTALRPWHDRLTCYLLGEQVPLKTAQEVLWCAAFLAKERPCRGDPKKKERPVGCPGARVLLGAGSWELAEEDRRHALTFAAVDASGTLRFDRDALRAFYAQPGFARLCPRSPARDPERIAAAFLDVPVRALGWPLVAELEDEVRRRLGARALEREHGFVLAKGAPELEAHAALELRMSGEEVEVHRAGWREPALARGVQLPVSVRRVLADGILLRGVRMDEGYVRLKGGHYELEQRLVLSTRVHLLPSDRPEAFRGYRLTTFPRATPEYEAWAQRVIDGLP